jgi:ubiquitin-protein ligase
MEKSAKRLFIELNKINLENRKNPNARKFIIDETPFNEDDDNAPPKTETDKDGIYYNVCGRILPTSNSYNKSAFKIKLRIPTEFPLKPPQVEMQTSIYHPNIGSQGKQKEKNGLYTNKKSIRFQLFLFYLFR